MTIEKSNSSKLFRRPRRPNLNRVDLVESIEREAAYYKVDDYDVDSDEYNEDDDDSSSPSESSPTHHVTSTSKTSSSNTVTTKFPPINRFTTRDQHLSIIEESNTINESTSGSYDNFQLYVPTANPNSPVSPELRQLYKTPINTRTSMMKSVHSAPAVARRSLVQPYKPLGPDPLPSRPPKLNAEDMRARKLYYQSLDADLSAANQRDEDRFELNDFLLDPGYNKRLVASCVKSISKYNYRQICQMLETQIQEERYRYSSQDVIHVQTLEPNIQPFINRKPMRQSMIEMANYLKNELSKKTGVQLKAKFNALPKWQRMKEGAESELIIYEDASTRKENQDQIEEESSSDEITHAHIAIVDCLLRNGLVLSLKAYSIDKLPDTSALKNTLVYINLSYNHFKEFPNALLEMQNLEVIKLRNNPIKYLPDSLGVLKNLKRLVLSYCQLRELSKSVYELENLNELDVSYNRLEKIDEDIIKLRKLKELNYEGNELEYLPCCMLRMDNLETINVRNNYLHPLFWRKHMQNEVQRLEDLAATKFCQVYGEDSIEFDNLDYAIQNLIINTTTRCDCCGEKRFGDGIKVIRPCVKIFNVKYLPFLFICCSSECYNTYKNTIN